MKEPNQPGGMRQKRKINIGIVGRGAKDKTRESCESE